MKHRGLVLCTAALLVTSLSLAGCGDSLPTDTGDQPAQLQAIVGTDLHRVTLTELAVQELGIKTQKVRAVVATAALTATPSPQPSKSAITPSPQPSKSTIRFTVIPITAVIYDAQGRSWTYTTPAPRTFTRKAIVIDHIAAGDVFLRSGPPAGTPVVTVGASELLGAEYGVGEE